MKNLQELIKSIESLSKNLKEDLLDLVNELKEHIPVDKYSQFIPKAEAHLFDIKKDFVEEFAKVIKPFSNGGWKKIKPKVQDLRQRSEKMIRRYDLERPIDDEAFNAALLWMIENGELEDIRLLEKIKTDQSPNDIHNLIELAEKRIKERAGIAPDDLSYQKSFADYHTRELPLKPTREDKPLILKLEDLQNNLTQVKRLLKEDWPQFTERLIYTNSVWESEGTENALEMLSGLFENFDILVDFFKRTQPFTDSGGLLSSYEQTPAVMNESLVQSKEISRDIDMSRLKEILSGLVAEIS